MLIIWLFLLCFKVLMIHAGFSMEEINMPETMQKVYESRGQGAKIPLSAFNQPDSEERVDVVMRRGGSKGGEIIVEAFQGNLEKTNLNHVFSESYNPFKNSDRMKQALRNLKGSASFLEGGGNKSFVDDRERIELIGEFPWTTIGYLDLITCIGSTCASVSSCTATLISQTVILTAAHCVYDLETDANGEVFGFYEDYNYYPGRSGDVQPFGKYDIVDAIVSGKWGNGALDFDYALMILGPGADGITAGSKTGWLGITVDCDEVEKFQLNLAGYPQDLSVGGDVMYYTFCDDVFLDACSSDTRLFEYQCTTARGMSGAPLWVYKKDADGQREIRGIHSRGLPDKSQGIFIDEFIFEFVQKEISASANIVGNNG
eukprot:TRINITY_DN3156_c0_g2_i3.p1 TRINITY_DN3156_c0_g2~~TRINITY_DN3156_c0_g2_i3.p1  ORF type:complete len:373 (+),score=57.18 TRINITY_DN3156_c0_g2_i3:92-1210(+)